MTEEAKASGRWYVLAVNSKRETWAKENLRRNGHEVFLPTLRKTVPAWVQHGGRRRRQGSVIVTWPLFPGYLFVNVRATTEWPSIFTTHGVKSAVGAGRPGMVRAGVVEALQAAEAAGFNELMSPDELDARLANVEAGDEVRVRMGGVLDELKAIFAGDVDDERCEVLVSLCGCDSRVKVHKARVSAEPG